MNQPSNDSMRPLRGLPQPTFDIASWLKIGALACIVQSTVGCASLNPFKKEDEYERARNKIEGYEDTEGNWVRPEGSRADRPQSSLPKFIQQIPGIGDRPVNKDLARQKYREADALFEQASKAEGKERRDLFRKAAKKYDDAGKDWVLSALQQDAMFMEAESHFFAEDYPKAENAYVQLVKEYPRNRWQDRVDKRRMEIGDYWLQFPDKFYNVNFTNPQKPWNDTKAHGKRVLEKILLDSPTSQLADDVIMEIANNEFQNENWSEALDRYGDLIKVYPSSPHQFNAHFLGTKAALLTYKGPQYSSDPTDQSEANLDPLDQADRLLKTMVRQFPEQARENKEALADMAAEVKYRKAERLFEKASFRANKEEFGAAKIYCDQILAEFDDTPFAEQAREILAKGDGKPEVPTRYLQSLTKVFPTRDKVTPLIKPADSPFSTQSILAREKEANDPNVRMAAPPGPERR